ncbi:hypothetical protein [Aquipuribacter hungaricus]|uniref:hypothetical protein n=1 Tax=Aquipuribacter hungaricus TaxID=545624 RepID=UPI0030ED5E75
MARVQDPSIIRPGGDHGGWIYPAGLTEFDLEAAPRGAPHPLSGRRTWTDPPLYCPPGPHHLEDCWSVVGATPVPPTTPAPPVRRTRLARWWRGAAQPGGTPPPPAGPSRSPRGHETHPD